MGFGRGSENDPGTDGVYWGRVAMVDNGQLSGMAVALVLTIVAVLVVPAAYFTEGRGVYRLWFCLAAIWLLACVLAYGINPTTWPFRRS